ncbi:MAG: rhodanese-like domain-containing protein [Planctomycetota bacterium]
MGRGSCAKTRSPALRASAGFWIVACAACGAPATGVDEIGAPAAADWRDLKARIREEFAGVDHLTIDDYLARRAAGGVGPVLVDVRPAAEHAVSWIPGARHAPLGAGFEAALADVPRDREVVLYCSVGWRSSVAAQQLQAAGYAQVFNLEGSIFEWANRGRPLENAGGAATRVHPYDAHWGRLLKPGLRGKP